MKRNITSVLLGFLAGILAAYYGLSRVQAVAIRETVSAWMELGIQDAARDRATLVDELETPFRSDRSSELGEAPAGLEAIWKELTERGTLSRAKNPPRSVPG